MESANLIVTHFGLCAWEALNNQIPVILLNHTSYHQKLTEQHLPEFTFHKKFSYFALKKKLETSQDQSSALVREKIGCHYPKVIQVIKKLNSMLQTDRTRCNFFISIRSLRCPLCKRRTSTIHRRSYLNLNFCSNCRHIFMIDLPLKKIFKRQDVKYHQDYFMSEYQKTYGRTYLEDRDNITRLAKQRLTIIKQLTSKKRILDVGCAYGFFLDAAKQLNYQTEGLEIAGHAANYASKNHLIHKGNFLHLYPSLKTTYDIISLWFVIEHFPDVHAIVDAVSKLQSPGDLVCISTPNARGFSSRFQSQRFLSSSPDDHYHIFSLKSLTRLFKQHEYVYVTSHQTGIHHARFQEKFPYLAQFINRKIHTRLAQKWQLGDTFNAYFMKRK